MRFDLVSKYKPTGDQPQAISELVGALSSGVRYNTLLGVTGSGKTFTVANVVAELNRPTLVLCHNKTLAAQLYSEFKNFFPNNAVEYYVSYYDYYQPEAYLPTTGTYIEKDLSINDEIEKMRLSTVNTLLTGRRDVIVISSVSCIYGMGNPEDFNATIINVKVGDRMTQLKLSQSLVNALYTRTEYEMQRGTFRVNGDSTSVMSALGDQCFRITHEANVVTAIEIIDPVSSCHIANMESLSISPAQIFVTTKERIDRAVSNIQDDMVKEVQAFRDGGRDLEAERLKVRVEEDLELIKSVGFCSGIENYSRYFDERKPGVAPFCLLDYFPEDFLMVVDESHVTLPQIRGMHGGDRARKENLVEYGFRLEAAKDNRPLSFVEYAAKVKQSLFVSATPGDYELDHCSNRVTEQLIRPTGLIDPPMVLRPATYQIDDLMEEISSYTQREDKVMVTTITKRMAEEVSRYLDRVGVRNRYIHSDIDTLERVQILDDLKAGLFDVLVGVNLLREGLDIPNVALVAILDADKEGFLRNRRSLTQIAGRAARNTQGVAMMYGLKCTDSLAVAILNSNRQRMIQVRYNIEHGIMPRQAQKSGTASSDLLAHKATEQTLTMEPRAEENHYVKIVDSASEQTPAAQSTMKVASPKGADYVAYPNEGGAADANGTPLKSGVVDYTTGDIIYPEVGTPAHEIEAIFASRTIDDRIADAKAAMEAAAKALDFKTAMKQRDLMHALVKERDTKDSEKTKKKRLDIQFD
ncbi:MAG: excinuclease ABC subunit UvrB [Rikenellaceae bacterium]